MSAPRIHELAAHDLACGYRQDLVLAQVNLTVRSGEVVCLLGPNGVGKTTLFKTLLGFLPARGGSVEVDGVPRRALSRRAFARRVAYVPQTHEPPFPFSVLDVVLTGCASRLGPLAAPGAAEARRAHDVLDQLGIGHLAERDCTHISGGEQQLVLIARALMQDSPLLMMDEPTAALDFGNQAVVLRRIRQMATEGHGILMTTHNPDHAFLVADRAVLIARDGTMRAGPVEEVVTAENLARAYGIPVKIATARTEDGTLVRACVPEL